MGTTQHFFGLLFSCACVVRGVSFRNLEAKQGAYQAAYLQASQPRTRDLEKGRNSSRGPTQSTPKMSIREATYADLLPASKILAAAFQDEPLFGGEFHPYRKEYPDDMHLFFLQKLRLDWARGNSPNLHILLSHPPSDSSHITGVAIWLRKRSTPQPDSWSAALTNTAMRATNAAEAQLYPNRAASPSRHGMLEASYPFIAHHWSGSRADSWYLDLLGVSPSEGGHGYGKALVRAGLAVAEQEGLGASVISALGKEGFYTALGFDMTVGTVGEFGGEANPFHGREDLGGTIHFRDGEREPTGLKGYGEK